jgi:TPR repeat protein
LGILYFFGQGVNQDYQAADIWFSQAAKLGDVESSRYLKAVKQFY